MGPATLSDGESRPGRSLGDSIVDRSESGAAQWRRTLQIGLGLIWLLDAGLQFQPYMFGRSFATEVLLPSADGTPGVVKGPVRGVAHLVLHHPTLWNSGFALIQLAIAIGILYRPTVRFGLAMSVVWSLAVWWLGEGMGGVFSGLTPVLGFPGAALLYGLIAVLLWPTSRATESVATSGPLGATAPKMLWFVLWGSYGWFLLLTPNRSPGGLARAVAGNASGEPQWEKSVDMALSRLVAHHGTEVSVALAAASVFAAFAVFVPRWRRSGLIAGCVMAGIYWIAQDFGEIFTSQGTDPNTGPLLALLALTFWVLSRPDRNYTTDFSCQ